VKDLIVKRGKYVYELFSIMVHQGSASGGHYYAYIRLVLSPTNPLSNPYSTPIQCPPTRNLSQNRWFCFNDSSVHPASMCDIQKTFGGNAGGWSVSNTNA